MAEFRIRLIRRHQDGPKCPRLTCCAFIESFVVWSFAHSKPKKCLLKAWLCQTAVNNSKIRLKLRFMVFYILWCWIGSFWGLYSHRKAKNSAENKPHYGWLSRHETYGRSHDYVLSKYHWTMISTKILFISRSIFISDSKLSRLGPNLRPYPWNLTLDLDIWGAKRYLLILKPGL